METSVQFEVERLKGLLRPQDVQPALRAAVNRTVTTFIARGSRKIAQSVNLRIGDIKGQFSTRRVDSSNRAEAMVTLSRKPVSLFKYLNSSQAMRGFTRPPGGINVQVRKNAPPERHVHSFIAIMKTGHIGVFHRGDKDKSVAGAKQFPIFEERAPTAVGTFDNAPDGEFDGSIFDGTCQDAAEVLIKNIQSQAQRFLAQYAAGK